MKFNRRARDLEMEIKERHTDPHKYVCTSTLYCCSLWELSFLIYSFITVLTIKATLADVS